MISWLLDPANAQAVSAGSFVITLAGFGVTFWGLILTYRQAKSARAKAVEIEEEIIEFSMRSDKSEAIGLIGEAKAAMEFAGPLAASGEWKEASLAYDQARKALQRARVLKIGLAAKTDNELRLICEHLIAFSDMVDVALAEKGDFPVAHETKRAIRRNTEKLARIQRLVQEAI